MDSGLTPERRPQDPFELDGWRVEPQLNRMRRAGDLRQLEPKVMDVLVELARVDGAVLSKDELLERVWSNAVVVDDVVYRTIHALRGAFGDDGRNARVIETVPKRGYRLLLPVQACPLAAATATAAAAATSWGIATALLAAAALIAALVVTRQPSNRASSTSAELAPLQVVTVPPRAPTPVTRSERPIVAVLPFRDLTEKQRSAWLADGLCEELIHTLGNTRRVRVIARTSSFAAAREARSAVEIGRRLGAQALVEGSVSLAGQELRVTVRLVDAATGLGIWSRVFERPRDQLHALQQDVARAVLATLSNDSHGAGSEGAFATAAPTRDADALMLFLEARFQFEQRNAESLRRAAALLRQVVELDPGFARAHALRANVLFVLAEYSKLPQATVRPLMQRSVERALALDAREPDAHIAHGMIAAPIGREDPALDAFTRAVELAPDHPVARYRRGERLLSLGYIAEAGREMERALELDPLSASGHGLLAFQRAIAGRAEEAWSAAQLARELGSARAGQMQSYVWVARADYERAAAARAESLRAMQRDDVFAPLVYAAAERPEDRAARDAALTVLGALDPGKHDDLHYDYGLMGRTGEALAALRRHGSGGGFGEIWMPELGRMRADPRFAALMQEFGFVDYWRHRGWPDRCAWVRNALQCR